MFDQVKLHAVAVFFFGGDSPDGAAFVTEMQLVRIIDECGVETGKRSTHYGCLSIKVDSTLVLGKIADGLIVVFREFGDVAFEFSSKEVFLRC